MRKHGMTSADAPVSRVGKPEKKGGQFAEIWKRLRKSTPAMISLCFIVILVLSAVLAPWIAPYDYQTQDLRNSLEMPSASHLMGTDQFGRDIFSRVLYGGRISLLVSCLSVAISLGAAIIIGATVGYFGGMFDTIVMRILDVFMAIPSMMLCIVIASIGDGGMFDTALAIAIGGIPVLARTLRSSVLLVKDEQYLEAANACGASHFWNIRKHVLPNTLAPIIVQMSIGIGSNIVAIAGLSLLGLGVSPPTPEWGQILSDGRQYIRSFWPLITYPGILIGLTMLAFNLFGDGLRDAMDPRLK